MTYIISKILEYTEHVSYNLNDNNKMYSTGNKYICKVITIQDDKILFR